MTVKAIKQSKLLRDQNPWKRDWKENWFLYVLFLPVLAYFVIFHYIPMSGIFMAFEDFKVTRGLFGSEWVGFEKFIELFEDEQFWLALRNSGAMALFNLTIGFIAPIILALLIANNKKKKLVRESDEVRMKLKNKLLELNNARTELEEYEKNFDIKIIPQEHRSYESLDYMAELLGSYQAINLGDAFRLCSERDHFKRMEDLQKQQVDIQQKQLELMDQLADYDFDDTYDDDDFTLHETLKAFGGKQ